MIKSVLVLGAGLDTLTRGLHALDRLVRRLTSEVRISAEAEGQRNLAS